MGRIVHITRRERFSAAHKLWISEWDEETNYEVFGKCANPNWHGHNYQLFVTIKGEVNPETGFVVDLRLVSELINDKIISKLDHKNVNLDVDFMTGKMTSTENIAIAIWDEIKDDIRTMGGELSKIKLQETENNYVEYYGE